MKKIIFLLLLSTFSYSQQINDLVLTPSGFEPSVVEVPNTSSEAIFKKVGSWIKKTYTNPDLVNVTDDSNNYIRFRGSDRIFVHNGFLVQDIPLIYTVEVEIKDNKYRFKIIELKADGYIIWDQIFNSKGEMRKGKYSKNYSEKLQEAMNTVHYSLFKFITEEEQDGW